MPISVRSLATSHRHACCEVATRGSAWVEVTWNLFGAPPYLSFGAQAERGNNGIITYLNVPGTRTRFIYPGADYLYKSAAVLTGQCQQEGIVVPAQSRALTYSNGATRAQSRRDYSLDLQRVFDCLNRTGAWGTEVMPAHAVPVTAIHFGIEQDDRLYRDGEFTGATAPNAVWIAIDSVRLE